MKFSLILSILLFSAMGFAQKSDLQGEWKLSEMVYRGKPIALPNPDLNLRWTFFSNGTERLYWDRGTEEFCERFAHFSIENGLIKESVFALNPQNAIDCAKDSDMQLGRETQTKIEIQQDKILLHFPMGDEELVYILKEVL